MWTCDQPGAKREDLCGLPWMFSEVSWWSLKDDKAGNEGPRCSCFAVGPLHHWSYYSWENPNSFLFCLFLSLLCPIHQSFKPRGNGNRVQGGPLLYILIIYKSKFRFNYPTYCIIVTCAALSKDFKSCLYLFNCWWWDSCISEYFLPSQPLTICDSLANMCLGELMFVLQYSHSVQHLKKH